MRRIVHRLRRPAATSLSPAPTSCTASSARPWRLARTVAAPYRGRSPHTRASGWYPDRPAGCPCDRRTRFLPRLADAAHVRSIAGRQASPGPSRSPTMVGALSSPSGSITSGRVRNGSIADGGMLGISCSRERLGAGSRSESHGSARRRPRPAGPAGAPRLRARVRARAALRTGRPAVPAQSTQCRVRGRAAAPFPGRSGAGSGSARGSCPKARASARENRCSAGDSPERVAADHDVTVRSVGLSASGARGAWARRRPRL